MATANTIATLDGLYKIVYGDQLERIIPEFAKSQRSIPFSNRGKVGLRFEKPICVAQEWGITHAAPEAGAFALSAPMVGETKPAYVKPYQHVIRSRVAYDAAFQAEGSGQTAFKNATDTTFESMVESVRRRLECDILGYGRASVGRVSGTPASNVITITDATWSPGMWVGSKNAELEVFDGITGSDTKRTGYAGSGNTFTVTAVDLANKQITVDDDTSIAANDYLFFRTQRIAAGWNAMVGLRQIATTSGTLFNIDNSSYDIYAGLTYSAGSTDLSVDTIQKAAAQMSVRGVDGQLLCWASPTTYANLVSDLLALVRYDQKTESRYTIGAEQVTIWTPTGKVTVEAHPMVMEGEALLFQPRLILRSGSTDVTFNRAKMMGIQADGDNFFTELADNAGFEVRAYSGQFIFTHKPASVCLINNIVNS